MHDNISQGGNSLAQLCACSKCPCAPSNPSPCGWTVQESCFGWLVFSLLSLLSHLYSFPFMMQHATRPLFERSCVVMEATSNLTTNVASTSTSSDTVATIQIKHQVLIISMLLFQTHSTLGKMTGDLSIVSRDTGQVRVHWQRWWILTIFSLFTMEQCAIWNTFGPIAQSAEKVLGEHIWWNLRSGVRMDRLHHCLVHAMGLLGLRNLVSPLSSSSFS